MKTRILMITSSLFLGLIGITLSFLPTEVALYLKVEPTTITTLSLKLMSALYLGFGILNWMAKDTFIGGIYNRPISLGNLMHFGVGAIALVKVVINTKMPSLIIISLTIVYVFFALFFAHIFRTNPTKP